MAKGIKIIIQDNHLQWLDWILTKLVSRIGDSSKERVIDEKYGLCGQEYVFCFGWQSIKKKLKINQYEEGNYE